MHKLKNATKAAFLGKTKPLLRDNKKRTMKHRTQKHCPGKSRKTQQSLLLQLSYVQYMSSVVF